MNIKLTEQDFYLAVTNIEDSFHVEFSNTFVHGVLELLQTFSNTETAIEAIYSHIYSQVVFTQLLTILKQEEKQQQLQILPDLFIQLLLSEVSHMDKKNREPLFPDMLSLDRSVAAGRQTRTQPKHSSLLSDINDDDEL